MQIECNTECDAPVCNNGMCCCEMNDGARVDLQHPPRFYGLSVVLAIGLVVIGCALVGAVLTRPPVS